MTANVSIIIEKRESALKLSNSTLRFRPPDAPVPTAVAATAAGTATMARQSVQPRCPSPRAAGFLPPYGPSTCGGYQYQQRDQTDTSIEVRLTSPGDQPLRWVAGAYFADIDRHVVVSQGADLGGKLRAKAFIPTGGPNPTDLLYDDDFSSKVYAVFGQLAYDVMEWWVAAGTLAIDTRVGSEPRARRSRPPGGTSPARSRTTAWASCRRRRSRSSPTTRDRAPRS